jgi:anti-anti-sigma factor
MCDVKTQIWKSTNLTVESMRGKEPGTVVGQLAGPLTARDVYGSISPREFRNILEPQPGSERPTVQIIDLSGVPYVDSAGLGLIVNHYTWCKEAGIRMVLSGASTRVREQFRMMNMDRVLLIADNDEVQLQAEGLQAEGLQS